MKNQELKTLDLMILFCLFVALVGFTTHIVIKGPQDSVMLKAKRSAENISAQLVSLRLKNIHSEMKEKGRVVASQKPLSNDKKTKFDLGSQGTIGKDPWGQPYHFRFIANDLGTNALLMVWSAGPDGELAYSYESLGFRQVSKLGDSFTQSDDVGVLSDMPENL